MCKIRKYQGVPLVKIDEAHYRTPDDEFEIYRDDEFETECDGPHPCRLTKKMRHDIEARYYNYPLGEARRVSEARAIHGPNAFNAWQEGHKGWYCEGNETHWYSQWVAWTGEYGWTAEWVDTFTEAVRDLKRHLEVIDAVSTN